MRCVIIIALLLYSDFAVYAKTIYVPDDYYTIQLAIYMSKDGDTIIVKPGIYFDNLNFIGKKITVKSECGANETIIDGGFSSNSVVKFRNGENKSSILDGFTIYNGSAENGGGIYCKMSSPKIINNIIKENTALGGFVAGLGGGIYCYKAYPTIKNNIIINNNSNRCGGGIYCKYSSKLESRNYHIIANNIILNNDSPSGGGIFCNYANFLILVNNTIAMNTAFSGGGIYCNDNSLMDIKNTICWDNNANKGSEIYIGNASNPSKISINYSDLKGGKSSVFVESGCNLDWGKKMIDADPQFIDPISEDFHIAVNSPCKDSGNNFASGLPPMDFEGDPRKAYGNVDIGVDEFYPHLYYMGDATPDSKVELKFVRWPGTTPVVLFHGADILDPPLHSMWGDWYLEFPIVGPIDLCKIPSAPDGVLILSILIPKRPTPPYSIPMQAWIGDALTNLCVLEVK